MRSAVRVRSSALYSSFPLRSSSSIHLSSESAASWASQTVKKPKPKESDSMRRASASSASEPASRPQCPCKPLQNGIGSGNTHQNLLQDVHGVTPRAARAFGSSTGVVLGSLRSATATRIPAGTSSTPTATPLPPLRRLRKRVMLRFHGALAISKIQYSFRVISRPGFLDSWLFLS